MAHFDSSQPYYDKTKVPLWGRDPGRNGWDVWAPGGGGTGVTLYFMNKVWDPGGGGGWEMWETANAADPTGAAYPDPHGSGWGACSNYRVQGTRYE